MNTDLSVNKLVIQFARVPVLGEVKTRLAASIGGVAALAAHCELIQFGTSHWMGPNWSFQVWWDKMPDALALGLVDGMVPDQNHFVQQGTSLGARMTYALHSGLNTFDQVIIVGSDCPSVDETYLTQAFSSLEAHDVVLGPAEDGGFVLMGMSRTAKRVVKNDWLDGVAWGSSSALEQTVQRVSKQGLSHHLLAVRWDVDEETDWLRFKEGVTESQPVCCSAKQSIG